MEETIFFSQSGISVSNARFMVHGHTYAMNGVTSVRQAVNNPSRFGPVVSACIGLLFLLAGSATSLTVGTLLVAGAVFWWTQQKPDWIVVLSSASGETRALTSKNKAFIDGVIDALNQSIIHRG